MYLLTLKNLTFYVTHALVNVALKFYAVNVTSCNLNFKTRNSE